MGRARATAPGKSIVSTSQSLKSKGPMRRRKPRIKLEVPSRDELQALFRRAQAVMDTTRQTLAQARRRTELLSPQR